METLNFVEVQLKPRSKLLKIAQNRSKSLILADLGGFRRHSATALTAARLRRSSPVADADLPSHHPRDGAARPPRRRSRVTSACSCRSPCVATILAVAHLTPGRRMSDASPWQPALPLKTLRRPSKSLKPPQTRFFSSSYFLQFRWTSPALLPSRVRARD